VGSTQEGPVSLTIIIANFNYRSLIIYVDIRTSIIIIIIAITLHACAPSALCNVIKSAQAPLTQYLNYRSNSLIQEGSSNNSTVVHHPIQKPISKVGGYPNGLSASAQHCVGW